MTPFHTLRRHSGFRLFSGILLLFCAALVSPDTAFCADTRPGLPFSPGEKLTFALRWGIIPAGEATLEVFPHTVIDGEKANHFVLTARTNDFVDVFYKVRQRIDAYADLSMTRSLLYREVHTVHKTRRDAEIRFDWKQMKAQYVNFGKSEKTVSLNPGTFDPLSIFYYSRLFDPGQRRHLERPVTDGKKCVIGRAAIMGRETVEIDDITYDTYLVEPELKEVGGVFKKSRDAKIRIWVTADGRRVPVRIRSKVVIGSFTGDLVSMESPPARTPSAQSSELPSIHSVDKRIWRQPPPDAQQKEEAMDIRRLFLVPLLAAALILFPAMVLSVAPQQGSALDVTVKLTRIDQPLDRIDARAAKTAGTALAARARIGSERADAASETTAAEPPPLPPEKDPDYWYEKGALAATYGADKWAIKYFEKVVALDPERSDAWFEMGISYGELRWFDKAVEAVNKAIALRPESGLYYYGRGRIYLMLGAESKAMEDFKQAAELGNDDAQRYLRRRREAVSS